MMLEEIKKNLDKEYLNKLDKISFQPIFILGLNRSGTSILYKMLDETQNFNSITVYDVIFYNQIIYNHINDKEEEAKNKLNNFFIKQGQIDRGIDKLKYNSDFSEEYGFIIGQKSIVNKITPKNIDIFIELCKKISFISNNSKPVLLKNPMDFPNFLYIKKIFPNAKFIFIHRNPINVISSTMKALKYIFEEKKTLPPSVFKFYYVISENPLFLKFFRFCFSNFFPIGFFIITLYTRNALNYYIKNIKNLNKQDYLSLTYENLCSQPQKKMEEIMSFLGYNNIKKDFSVYIKPRKTNIDKSVIKRKKFIYNLMKKYFDHFNFKINENNF
jgi:hypothetical protein